MNKLSFAQEIHFDNFNVVEKSLNEALKKIDHIFERRKLDDIEFQKIDIIINNLVIYNNYLQILKLKYNQVTSMLNNIKIEDEN